MTREECIALIEEYFSLFFFDYVLVKKGVQGPFWWIEFINEKESIRILFDGDAGFDVKILIDDKEYPLWQFDKSVQKTGESKEPDIRHQLEVLKRFLLE